MKITKILQTAQGCIKVYNCSVQNCPALCRILFHAILQELTLYIFLNHNHGMDIWTNSEKTKDLVNALLSKRITKPSVIHTHLLIDLVFSDVQLTNLIQHLKKSSALLPFMIIAADLRRFCLDHCVLPVDIDKAYVVYFDLTEKEICRVQPLFRVLFSTCRLLENGLQG